MRGLILAVLMLLLIPIMGRILPASFYTLSALLLLLALICALAGLRHMRRAAR